MCLTRVSCVEIGEGEGVLLRSYKLKPFTSDSTHMRLMIISTLNQRTPVCA